MYIVSDMITRYAVYPRDIYTQNALRIVDGPVWGPLTSVYITNRIIYEESING